MVLCTEKVEALTQTIYRCALNMSDWTGIAEDIQKALPGSGAVLHVHDSRNPANIGLVEAGYDPNAIASYLSYYRDRNPWLQGMEEAAVGALVHTETLCDQDTFLASEFWNDWLKPQGSFSAGSGVVLSREQDRHAFLGVNYSHKSLECRAQTDELLTRIAPHLQRAFNLWRQTSKDRERSSVFETCLSTLPVPIVVVEANRTLRFANRRAECILRRMDGLMICAKQELRANDRLVDDTLGRIIGATATGGLNTAPLIRVPRKNNGASYVLTPFPIYAGLEDLNLGSFNFADGSLVMIAIHDMAETLRLDWSLLMEAFDLTRTEAELADAVLQGNTLADYAKRKCVSPNTVRNQLSSVMHKTETHRQAELVALLTRLAVVR